MNIYIYSDESGVFDKVHNDIFVFGGLIVFDNKEKNIWSRKYSTAEKTIRNKNHTGKNFEIKATTITNGEKNKLFRSLNGCYKFGVVINQKNVLDRIFKSKKDKQRYLDFAYKLAVKRAFENLINQQILNPQDVERLYFCVDEHTTATNGKYELCQGLEQEFKLGTYNSNYSKFFPPIFPELQEVQVEFCNSASKLLVRAADIVANKIYYLAKANKNAEFGNIQNMYIIELP